MRSDASWRVVAAIAAWAMSVVILSITGWWSIASAILACAVVVVAAFPIVTRVRDTASICWNRSSAARWRLGSSSESGRSRC